MVENGRETADLGDAGIARLLTTKKTRQRYIRAGGFLMQPKEGASQLCR